MNTKTTETIRTRRDSRLYHIHPDGWYVHTREGLKGPFADQLAAQQFLETLVRTNSNSSAHIDYTRKYPI